MTDREIVVAIEKLVDRKVSADFDEDVCVELRLTDPGSLYHGLVRRFDPARKQRILALIATLKGLEHLDLAKNRLEFIPDSFADLKHLRVLLLDSNALKTFPRWILALDKLEWLNLSVNELTEVPPELSKFRRMNRSLRCRSRPKRGMWWCGRRPSPSLS